MEVIFFLLGEALFIFFLAEQTFFKCETLSDETKKNLPNSQTKLLLCEPPSPPPAGSESGHGGSHWRLHVAPALVHVGGHLRHAAPHGALPHPVRVEQPLRHDAARQEQAARLLLLLRPQPLLRHIVRPHRRHQGTASRAPRRVINGRGDGWTAGGGELERGGEAEDEPARRGGELGEIILG